MIEAAIALFGILITLEWSNYLFGLANTLIGLMVALIVLAWRYGLWPFPLRA